jgi:hypothetical protein
MIFKKGLIVAVAVSIPTLAFAMPVQPRKQVIQKAMMAHAEWRQATPARMEVYAGDANSMYGWNSAANNDGGRTSGGGDGGSAGN